MIKHIYKFRLLFAILWFSGFACKLCAQEGISWPEISKEKGKNPLILQLAVSSPKLAYGQPFDFYIRFVNCGNTDLEIVLPVDFINEYDILKSTRSNNILIYPNTFCGATVLLPSQAIAVVKIPNLYPKLGKHTQMVSYKYPDSKKEVKSNIVKYVCEQKPFSEVEVVTCNQQLEEAICALSKEKVSSLSELEFSKSGRKVSSIGIACCPYSLPVLKRHLAGNPDPGVRYVISLTLQFLAGKEYSEEMGFIPDLSSADLLIDRLAEEKDSRVLVKNLGTFHLYSSSGCLTTEQKKRLFDRIMTLVDSEEQVIRTAAAYALLNSFPDHCDVIEKRLAQMNFYADGKDTGILVKIKEVKAKILKP
jgi:hypothetical protein